MATAGRKPAQGETRDVTIQVRLTPTEADRLRKVAASEERSVSNFVRTLVINHTGRRAK